jgi:hypothetical protein
MSWMTGIPSREGIAFFTVTYRLALELTQPPIQPTPRAVSSGVQWPGCEADHSPPSNSEVKGYVEYTATPPFTYLIHQTQEKCAGPFNRIQGKQANAVGVCTLENGMKCI